VWRWQPHPEVWLLVVSVVACFVWAVRVLGPKAVPPGQRAVSRSQIAWFTTATLVLWVASDWPIHDLGEEYLYSVHMFQHMLFSYAMPAMFLLATPTWLARAIVGDGRAYRVLKKVARPIPAAIFFNGVVLCTHIPGVVNNAVSATPLHYLTHTLLVLASLLMWLPVCGPLPELRISLPSQMVYLFVQSVGPTVPAGWLTFAEGAVYKVYDHPVRVWGLSVTEDQQFAGLIMKLGGSTFLWTIIIVLFARWVRTTSDDHDHSYRRSKQIPPAEITGHDEVPLRWSDVERAFEQAPPAPEPVTPSGS
jgi:putative membrane protein